MTLPIGSIIIWSGESVTIPVGWQKCNGLNGTPDLFNKFVMGATADSDIDTTGGATTHLHTLASTGDGTIGSHDHTLSGSVGAGGTGTLYYGVDGLPATSGHDHTFSGNTGNTTDTHSHSLPDTNSASSYPPYTTYYYIMRIT